MASKRWFDEHLNRGCLRAGVLGRGERRIVTFVVGSKSALGGFWKRMVMLLCGHGGNVMRCAIGLLFGGWTAG